MEKEKERICRHAQIKQLICPNSSVSLWPPAPLPQISWFIAAGWLSRFCFCGPHRQIKAWAVRDAYLTERVPVVCRATTKQSVTVGMVCPVNLSLLLVISKSAPPTFPHFIMSYLCLYFLFVFLKKTPISSECLLWLVFSLASFLHIMCKVFMEVHSTWSSEEWLYCNHLYDCSTNSFVSCPGQQWGHNRERDSLECPVHNTASQISWLWRRQRLENNTSEAPQ